MSFPVLYLTSSPLPCGVIYFFFNWHVAAAGYYGDCACGRCGLRLPGFRVRYGKSRQPVDANSGCPALRDAAVHPLQSLVKASLRGLLGRDEPPTLVLHAVLGIIYHCALACGRIAGELEGTDGEGRPWRELPFHLRINIGGDPVNQACVRYFAPADSSLQ